eukprot:symbB.v1.2.002110.t1/scaffold114.1/size323002/16
MQPPSAYRMGEGMPTNTHLMQPATAPCMNESALLNGRLPPTTLLTSPKPANLQNADKESCAEEGLLDDDKFGAEDKGPSQDYTYCGVDLKPVLPVALAVSTVIGGLCVLLVQIPMLARFTSLPQVWLSAPFGVVYGIVLGCMAYCAFSDPGQVKKTRNKKIGAVGGMDIEEGMPRRAHKSWQYSRPIRRFDHYCKWLQNVIGLLNHREFVIMVGGLLLIGVLGIMVDIWLAILITEKGFYEFEIVVALHLGYSVALLAIDGPIFKIHFGLISRNETAQEWKKNEHYVANNTSIGDNVPVEDLEDDEYNELFDRFSSMRQVSAPDGRRSSPNASKEAPMGHAHTDVQPPPRRLQGRPFASRCKTSPSLPTIQVPGDFGGGHRLDSKLEAGNGSQIEKTPNCSSSKRLAPGEGTPTSRFPVRTRRSRDRFGSDEWDPAPVKPRTKGLMVTAMRSQEWMSQVTSDPADE